jgi:hypothetical protein
MYHTQERRAVRLTVPLECTRNDAWLGDGYYFWWYAVDAKLWGERSKKATGWFEVYKADADLSNVLDTVFNPEHYEAWNEIISSITEVISKKTGHKATLQQLNDYVNKQAGWAKLANVDGILFEDSTPDSQRLLVIGLPHRKRIQLVAYTLRIITGFSFYKQFKCPKG